MVFPTGQEEQAKLLQTDRGIRCLVDNYSDCFKSVVVYQEYAPWFNNN